MNKSAAALSIIAIVLAGCDAVSERECGVFDHPDLAVFQANTGADQLQFMSAEGIIRNFSQAPVVLNTPFRGTDGSSNDEDVICELTATIRLQATDNSLAINVNYLQQERLLLEPTDESLFVDPLVEVPAGNELIGGFLADISVSVERTDVNPGQVIFLEPEESDEEEDIEDEELAQDEVLTEEIGGQVYEDVIRINALELTGTDEEEVSIDEIQQIVLAREFGVVAFTDSEGQEFARVPLQ